MSKRHGLPLVTLILVLCLGAIPAGAAPFKPGSRSLGDPLLPQLGNGGYDATHYDIDLDFDPVANVFDSAVTTMTCTRHAGPVGVQPRLPGPRRAGRAGERPPRRVPAGRGHARPQRRPVPQPADEARGHARGRASRKGTQFTVEVDYSGAEPQAFTDPDELARGLDAGLLHAHRRPRTCNSYFVVGEPIGSQAWFPSNNYPIGQGDLRHRDHRSHGRHVRSASGELAEAPGTTATAPAPGAGPRTTRRPPIW